MYKQQLTPNRKHKPTDKMISLNLFFLSVIFTDPPYIYVNINKDVFKLQISRVKNHFPD